MIETNTVTSSEVEKEFPWEALANVGLNAKNLQACIFRLYCFTMVSFFLYAKEN